MIIASKYKKASRIWVSNRRSFRANNLSGLDHQINLIPKSITLRDKIRNFLKRGR
jgi:hypothetical protein